MGLNLYEDVLKVNRKIYSEYAIEYQERTKNGHANYLKSFLEQFEASITGSSVFDLGCGPGRDLEYFINRGFNAIGVDCSEGMVQLCREKNLPVIQTDFLSLCLENNSVDGIWAYTSHTVIPKKDFQKLLRKYQLALKKDTGVLAFGMIEGDYEGWKSDGKYEGTKRFVARYQKEELEMLLRKYFGSVTIVREIVGEKVYLHCLCKNTPVASKETTAKAAQDIFDKFSSQYLVNTQTGITLLNEERLFLVHLLQEHKYDLTLLDIGCGPGRDLLEFNSLGLDAIGVDISQSNVDLCLQQGTKAVKGDIYALNTLFEENSFSAAWCNCSVTNWIVKEELHNVLQSIKQIVRKDGYIFIGSILGSFSGWEIDNKYDGMKRYNIHWQEEEIKAQLSFLGEIVFERKLINTGKKDYLNLVIRNEK